MVVAIAYYQARCVQVTRPSNATRNASPIIYWS